MNWPSVACICVTRNRRLFLDRAVKYIQRSFSFYPGKCWMVVIDGSEERRVNVFPYVKYFHEPETTLQIGHTRNRACEESKGADIIIHWDDDDWQHPKRIVRQVETLLQSPGDGLACTSRYYTYHVQQRQAVKANSWMGEGGSMGATFAYWRESWERTPFREVEKGDDIFFQGDLRDRGCPLLDAKDHEMMVYMRHNQNQSALTQYQWNEEDTLEARKLMGADVDFYDGIGELLPIANWAHPNAPGSKMHIMNPLQQSWGRHFK
jgi:hypothetical protein